MLTSNAVNLIVVVAIVITNAHLWYFKYKHSAWVKEIDNKSDTYFYKHTFLFWSLGWILWALFYLLLTAIDYNWFDILHRPAALTWLQYPPLYIFMCDLNSVAFLGVNFAYLRGRDYKKTDFFLLAFMIMVVVTCLQLSLYQIDLEGDDMFSINGVNLLFFTPSLMLSVTSYFMLGFGFFRRLRYRAIFLAAISYFYAALQIPGQVIFYNSPLMVQSPALSLQQPAQVFFFFVLASMKILVAMLFYESFAATRDCKNLLVLSAREAYRTITERKAAGVYDQAVQKMKMIRYIVFASLVLILAYWITMYFDQEHYVALLMYFSGGVFYLTRLRKYFRRL